MVAMVFSMAVLMADGPFAYFKIETQLKLSDLTSGGFDLFTLALMNLSLGFSRKLLNAYRQARFQTEPAQLFPRTQLPVGVGESRFEDITDWLPRAAVELN
jgi:hypothetical protein